MTIITPPETEAAFRAAIVAALDGPTWMVLPEPTDAIQPPCFAVLPAMRDDWFTPLTGCAYLEVLDVAAIVGRIDLAPVFGDLAAMVTYALAHLRGARIPCGNAMSAAVYTVAGVDYLASRIAVSQTIVIDPEVS